MDGDTQAQLRQAAEYAAAYSGRLKDAESALVPGAEGADSTGTVEVKLGSSGIPVSVRIGQHWLRAVGSERLGAAVLEACTAASISRAAAGVPLDDILNIAPGGIVETRVGETPPPRQIESIVADVIRLLDSVSSATVNNIATGTAAMSRVEVTVSQDGVLSCVVDPAWAARQAAAIEAALAGAFASATEALDRTVTDGDPAAGLDALLHESMSMLGQLRRQGR